MKIYDTIEELLRELHVEKASIHPDFHIFKFSETSDISEQALKPHRKRFFTIDFYANNESKRQIGHKLNNLMVNPV